MFKKSNYGNKITTVTILADNKKVIIFFDRIVGDTIIFSVGLYIL